MSARNPIEDAPARPRAGARAVDTRGPSRSRAPSPAGRRPRRAAGPGARGPAREGRRG
jgi:hypothetical protein